MARSDKAVAKASILMMLNNKQFNAGVNQTRKTWESFCSRVDSLNKKTFNNSAFGQKIVGGLQGMTAGVTKLAPALNIAGSALMGIARTAAAAGAGIAAGVGAGIGASIKAAADLENEALGLKMVMGDAAGGEMVEYIRSFYPSTSGSRSVFLQAAQDLARMGKSAPEIKQLLQAFGDVGALSKLGTDAGIEKMTAAFKTLTAEGQLSARTVRAFREVGVDFYSILAGQLGSLEAAQEAVKSGSIDAAQAQMLFMAYMQQYYGAMQAYSNTASGTLGTIKAQITELAVGIGNQFLPMLKEFGGRIQDFITYLAGNLPNLQQLIVDVAGAIAGALDRIIGRGLQLIDVVNGISRLAGAIRHHNIDELGGAIGNLYDIGAASASENYVKARGQQLYQSTGLKDALTKYGFAPEQIQAGMAAAQAQRAARDMMYEQRRGTYAEGARAFDNTKLQEEVINQLQSVNDKLSNIGNQNNAAANQKIPVRGGVY